MQTITVKTGKQQAKAYSGVMDFMTQNAQKAALACRFKAGNPISRLLYSSWFHGDMILLDDFQKTENI